MYVVFTDLDGTLIDEHYEYGAASRLLAVLKENNIPIIFCSAKTRAEQEALRQDMEIADPFIVEEGSAVFIPRGHFPAVEGDVTDHYETIILGTAYKDIERKIRILRHQYTITSYGTMTDEEVAQATGLSLEGARLAKEREFSETVVEADPGALEELKKHFNIVQGGQFIQVFGPGTDKGKAVEHLTRRYRASGEVTTIGVGNAANDEPMLKSVDIPALVRNPDGHYADITLPNLYRAQGVGPQGWAETMQRFIGEG